MILGGAGHRPDKLGGWDERNNPVTMRVCTRIEAELVRLAPSHVLTGMALGTDLWLAQLCLKLKIPYLAYVPFEGQDSRWPMFRRYTYTDLLYKAQRVVVCSPTAPVTHTEAAWMMQKRNEMLVDAADEMLIVFDGSKGGTFNCISYALEQQKPIHYLCPPW